MAETKIMVEEEEEGFSNVAISKSIYEGSIPVLISLNAAESKKGPNVTPYFVNTSRY